MTLERAFPAAIIALSAGAAIVYALQHDWRHAAYWTGAVVVGLAVTW